MLLARSTNRKLVPGRFAHLMGLYADNYWRLVRLFGPERLPRGVYVSTVADGLDLRLDVIEQHPYTLELKLSYLFHDRLSGQPEPSAYLRLYRDAQVAEVTSCYVGERLEDLLGADVDARTVFDHRLHMNTFLNKWLEYLDGRGHSRFSLNPLPEPTAPA